MKFISIVIVVLVSLIVAGIATLFNVIGLTGIGFWYWVLISTILTIGSLQLQFKTWKRFRLSLIRVYISLNKFFKRIDAKMKYNEDLNATELQEKAIGLWKLCLKDKDTNLSSSLSNQYRQIEKRNMMIVLSPINAVDYLMTIMDVDNSKSCLYEVRIGQKMSEGIISLFDTENERRMRLGEEERRSLIFKDLDKLHQEIKKSTI